MSVKLVTVNSETGEILRTEYLSKGGFRLLEEINYSTEDGNVFSKELNLKSSNLYAVVNEGDECDFILEIDTRSSVVFGKFDNYHWKFNIKAHDRNNTHNVAHELFADLTSTIFKWCGDDIIKKSISLQMSRILEDDERFYLG